MSVAFGRDPRSYYRDNMAKSRGGNVRLAKRVLIVLNFFGWAMGVALFVLGMVMKFMYHVDDLAGVKFTYLLYTVIAFGLIVALVCTLGMCGAAWENSCMLGTFVGFLAILFVGEVTCAALLYVNRKEILNETDENLLDIVTNGYHWPISDTIDLIQRKMSCCGVNTPQDWFNSRYGHFPASCYCDVPTADRDDACAIIAGEEVYQRGCLLPLKLALARHTYTLAGLCMGIAILQVVNLTIAAIMVLRLRAKPPQGNANGTVLYHNRSHPDISMTVSPNPCSLRNVTMATATTKDPPQRTSGVSLLSWLGAFGTIVRRTCQSPIKNAGADGKTALKPSAKRPI
ncbi:23 kDa integral membrane protein-like [Branchiostoma lanceolatum]|uniref:23 kDa integral membrane protein-like n=1 Tax=Branchiostoma lanceolatum TaxID=7740 RepID=UPI0034548F2B